MGFLDKLLDFITSFFKSIGNFADYPVCRGFFDEPETPKELLDLDE
ncbi:cyclic lactone autoinducer peptide AgrD [Staphylococcus coagulans]|nr:cyclic lactone autoinducer peptide [Staphylococcus coagulans]MBA8765011.1 cyclic lactone autoinducer peptide [Staphylococcus coagulans]MBT2810592.1 cyclic lactone autoinducer peptide [Staphylococcus coagulans]MBT2812696.1 cyclic lactone autoinducer peptide [Staphylococcus coagulans]MBT2819532.1 cyclic lactone autoinducer peptide [Staphylococcus coagulans]MBT2822026.1 cyclic lactone autoinducer peptide [Staphylococcus coagulans]